MSFMAFLCFIQQTLEVKAISPPKLLLVGSPGMPRGDDGKRYWQFRVFRKPSGAGCCGGGDDFAGNAIRTSKYNLITFIPLNLFEQFQRASHVYFLLISILQFMPLSPMTPTSWIPLAFVLILNAFKEAVEDYQRVRMDKVMVVLLCLHQLLLYNFCLRFVRCEKQI